jgi:hypothetical protein
MYYCLPGGRFVLGSARSYINNLKFGSLGGCPAEGFGSLAGSSGTPLQVRVPAGSYLETHRGQRGCRNLGPVPFKGTQILAVTGAQGRDRGCQNLGRFERTGHRAQGRESACQNLGPVAGAQGRERGCPNLGHFERNGARIVTPTGIRGEVLACGLGTCGTPCII